MVDLTPIIEFEQEHTALDFKLEEYGKFKKIDLVKDVMAMANASTQADRYIVIGMKPDAASRGIIGLPAVSDAANIQQTIIDNIEPEIKLDYFSYDYQGKQLGILRIYDCSQRPYLMKKDLQADKSGLRRGEGFVRMGTTQMRLYRSLFEQIYKERYQHQQFHGVLQVSFKKKELTTTLGVSTANISLDDMPSSAAKRKIEKIIAKKEIELANWRKLGLKYDEDYLSMGDITIASSANLMGGGIPYENRSLTNLRRNLANVTSTYYKDDSYFLLEGNSEKLVLFIKNLGNQFLQGVKVVLHVPKKAGMLLAEELPRDPDAKMAKIDMHYPRVEDAGEYYEVSKDLGDLKQQLESEIFIEPLRISFLPKYVGHDLKLELFFYAKNLSAPIREELTINIIKLE